MAIPDKALKQMLQKDQVAPSLYRNQSEGDHKVQSIKQGEDIALDDLPGTGTGIRFKFVGLATLYFFCGPLHGLIPLIHSFP